MRYKSCFIRYVRFMLRSCACSVLTFFVNSNMLINKSGVWLLSTVIFTIITSVDTWFFCLYIGKRRHIKYGVVYPYSLFMLTTYIGHFAITSVRWRYFFLPFGIFEILGMSRLASISLVHISNLVLIYIFSKLGQRKFYKDN